MKYQAAKLIYKAAQENDYEVELIENYSGRGMFGKTTTGLVLADINVFIRVVAFASKMFVADNDYLFFEDFLNDFLPVKMDSLGNDFIFY